MRNEMTIYFLRDGSFDDHAPPLPDPRSLSVKFYGGTAEECIAKARELFKLDKKWEVSRIERD